MSNPDSFIEEVTEEVRRDRLFGLMRRYGWIGVVAVMAVVGGTAWSEWANTRAEARAQAFGDAILDALDQGTPEERSAALAAIPVDGAQTPLLQLILSADPDADPAVALAALDRLIADDTLAPPYRDLATLRRVLLAGAGMPLADRRAALERIAVAGRPYRTLATELLAYLLVEEGKTDEAIKALTALIDDQEASAALRARAEQMVTALGGTMPVTSEG